MSILDNLSILGAGIARGYRGKQELIRQINEARRKALLDEREQAAKERQIALAEALGSSTIASEGEARLVSQAGRAEADRARARGLTRIMPEGQNPRMDLLGGRVSLPNTLETLLDPNLNSLFRELEGNAASRENAGTMAGSRRDVANIRVGNFTREKGSPAERRAKYIEQAISGIPPWVETSVMREIYSMKIDLAKQNDPEAFGLSPSDSTSTKKSNSGVTRSGLKYVIEP